MKDSRKASPPAGGAKVIADRDRLIADYEWLRRMMRLLDLQAEQVDRQLIELEGVLPDDYASIYEAYAEGQLLPTSTNLGRHLARLAGKLAGITEQGGKKKFSLFGK